MTTIRKVLPFDENGNPVITWQPNASENTSGVVKVDGSTIISDNNGVISVANGGAGGTSRNVGEIVQSTLPLTDAGLHLLDGTRLSGDGIYKGFYDYIAELYTENPNANYFCTESEWQASVNKYGVCGKFVYDSENNTVRLPKITGIIEGTTDVNALGDLIKQYVKLPNITGHIASATGTMYETDGAFTINGTVRGQLAGGYNGNLNRGYFDASRSSSVYSGNGNDTKIQPQAVKLFVYIVIATCAKTDIQVDIDQIATDLNSKANTDLSNVSDSKGILIESYYDGDSWYRVYSDGWCEQGGFVLVPSTKQFSLTFLKPFRDITYTPMVTGNWSSQATGQNEGIEYGWTPSKMVITTSYGPLGTWWTARGYIK